MTKQEYHRRIEENLCVKCGKVPPRDGKRTCEKCAEKVNRQNKQNKRYYISIGLCPRCHKRRIFQNEKSCPDCKEKIAEYQSKKYNNNKEKGRKTARISDHKRRKEKSDSGVCVKCGKRKPLEGKKRCEYCLAKIRGWNTKSRREAGIISIEEKKERSEIGFCWFCGEPVKEGYKVCEEHYQKITENATCENANKARQELIKQGILY